MHAETVGTAIQNCGFGVTLSGCAYPFVNAVLGVVDHHPWMISLVIGFIGLCIQYAGYRVNKRAKTHPVERRRV